MTIHYCDKCGKEIDKSNIWKIKTHAINTATKFAYELCSECTLKFRHWIEDKPEPCKAESEKSCSNCRFWLLDKNDENRRCKYCFNQDEWQAESEKEK